MKRLLISMALLSLAIVCQHVAASEQEAKAYLDYFEYFLGEWSVAAEGGDTGTWAVAVSPSGCSVTTLLKLGDVTSHGEYGYDPTTSTWLGVGFSSKGTRWSEALKKPDSAKPRPGDVIYYSGKVVANDGTEKLSKMRLEFISDDTFQVAQTILDVQGDAEPFVRKLTSKRKQQ